MPDELIVLGSASALPTQRRFPSAYALKVASKLFLLDCGAPVSTLLFRYGLDPIEVRAVFLSHWHMDHVANLGLLLSQNHLRKRARALHIYGPRGTRGKIRRLLFDSFIIAAELSYKLNITNVEIAESYQEGLVQVTFFETQHLEQPKYKTYFGPKAVACGMIIEGPDWRVIYSGDVSSSQELAPYVEGCDLLIHEMAHHRPEAVAEFAAAARIPHVLISHLGPEFDETPEKITTAFAGRYHGDLIVAEDGVRLRLSQIRAGGKVIIEPPHDGIAQEI
jgi:ribonuclease Z